MVADFIQRVGGYPVVSSAVGQANSYYTWAKERHDYIRSAADLTESGLKKVASGTQPLLHRFEQRITSLDELACQQLDKLETSYPTIREPTDKVVEKTYDYYNAAVKPKVDFVLTPVTAAVATVRQAKSYGMQKVGAARDSTSAAAASARDYGLEKYRRLIYSRHGQAGLHALDQLIASADQYLDRCLPEETQPANEGRAAAEGEEGQALAEEEGQAEPGESVQRALTVSRKLRRRVHARAAKTLLRLGKPVGVALDKVHEFKDDFWVKVDELEKSASSDNTEVAKTEELSSSAVAKAYLHRAQVFSVAGLQVTGDYLPPQLMNFPATLRVSTERGVHVFRGNMSALMEFVQHNRLSDYFFDTGRTPSGSTTSVEDGADDQRHAEAERPTGADTTISSEDDALETTDDIVDDSDPEASD